MEEQYGNRPGNHHAFREELCCFFWNEHSVRHAGIMTELARRITVQLGVTCGVSTV